MEPIQFKDMTPEQRSKIVEALVMKTEIEVWYSGELGDKWVKPQNSLRLYLDSCYRIPSHKLDIPWNLIKPKFKWAAMDQNCKIYVYTNQPEILKTMYSPLRGSFENLSVLDIDTTSVDWEESLVQRP